MRMLETPFELSRRGVTWPKIVLVGSTERPPEGIPYLRWDNSSDKILIFRLMLPILEKKFGFFKWRDVYAEMVGEEYKPVKLNYDPPKEDHGNNFYYESTGERKLPNSLKKNVSEVGLV